jgi:Lon protease-like protein
MNTLNLPIFPLPVFLLPNGITRLRIFEPKYLKMIKIATKGQGFVITPNYKDTNNSDVIWGSQVEIINFDQGDDGVLEIDVKSTSLVEITSLNKDESNLLFGDISLVEHWSHQKESPEALDEGERKIKNLSISLDMLFKNDNRLADLYTDKPFDNGYWVVARWLELLPVPMSVKTTFISTNSYNEAKKFIQSIILK